jgi:hypothetical protein
MTESRIEPRTVTIPYEPTGWSLVGVHGRPPHRHGNYHDIRVGKNYNVRVLNMWLENARHAAKTFCDGEVRVRLYEGANYTWCLIDDERIPADYYYNKLCFTGGRMPPAYVALDMYEHLGDPDNEYEQFTDPTTYHGRRGFEYNAEHGFISGGPEIRERMRAKYGVLKS